MENNSNDIEIIDSNEKTYTTKEIADMLNIKDQTIRNYCSTYEELLDRNHRPGKHRTFNKNDINKLKIIIYLSKEKNMKPRQIINYLNKPNQTKNIDLITSLEFLFDDVKNEMTNNLKQSIHEEMQNEFNGIKEDISLLKNSNNRLIENNDKFISTIETRVERNKKKKHWFNIFK
jgi:DNA-binding transcriptional MerR regulator